jgi:hypothetical protein
VTNGGTSAEHRHVERTVRVHRAEQYTDRTRPSYHRGWARVMRYPAGLTEASVRTDWSDLGAATGAPARYDPDAPAGLPEPVRRWLAHAIAPGTALRTAVELSTHGTIRLGAWRDFAATQRLSIAGGFVWAGTATKFGLPVVGFDRYSRRVGQMSWKLFGRFPVDAAGGPDVTRSAAGRHAGELLVAVPAAAFSRRVSWRPVDADRATARIRVDAGYHEVQLTVAEDGALRSMVMSRWGSVADGSFGDRVFGAEFADEATFEGFTIPRTVVAGWDLGTPGWSGGQFIRYTVDAAHYG